MSSIVIANGVPIVLIPPPLMPPLALPFDPPANTAGILFNGAPVVTFPCTMGGFPLVSVTLLTTSLFNGAPAILVGAAFVLSNGYSGVIPDACGAGSAVNVV